MSTTICKQKDYMLNIGFIWQMVAGSYPRIADFHITFAVVESDIKWKTLDLWYCSGCIMRPLGIIAFESPLFPERILIPHFQTSQKLYVSLDGDF